MSSSYLRVTAVKSFALCFCACVYLSLVSAAPLDPAQYSATSLTWRASVARALYTASSEYKLNDLHMTREDEDKWWNCVFHSRREAGVVEICAGTAVMGHSRYVNGINDHVKGRVRRRPGLRDRMFMLRTQFSPVESFFFAGCLGLGMTVILRMMFMLCLAVGKGMRRREMGHGVRSGDRKRRSIDGGRSEILHKQ